MSINVYRLILVAIVLTCAKPLWASKGTACSQVKLISLYQSETGPLFQEAVATAIHWQPSQEEYLITVAHAVHQASLVIGYCESRAMALEVVGTDTTRDVALLKVADGQTSFLKTMPLFNLPQPSVAVAIQRAQTQKLTSPKAPSTEVGVLDKALRKMWGPPTSPFAGNVYEALEGNRDFKRLAILHPFFKESKLNLQSVNLTDFIWTPLVESETGIYRLQSAHQIKQFILNEQFASDQSNPFLNFRPLYLTLGVRPGMSGSPVFEYLDTNLENRHNVLVGLVSKTKTFENMSLLVPANVVQEAIGNILQGTRGSEEGVFYNFEKKTGRLYPYYASKELGLSLSNACDGDFGNTSEIKTAGVAVDKLIQKKLEESMKQMPVLDKKLTEKIQALKKMGTEKTLKKVGSSQGGDWGDGGGNVLENNHYLFTPYFTESRYVPKVACARSGLVDQKGRQYIGYRQGSRIHPLRNLDQLIAAQNGQNRIRHSQNLVPAAQGEQVMAEVCGHYVSKTYSNGSMDLIMPQTSAVIQNKKEMFEANIVKAIFADVGPGAEVKQFYCPNKQSLFLEVESKHLAVNYETRTLTEEILANIKITGEPSQARLSAQLGHCRIEQSAQGNAFEYSFKDPQAHVRLVLETANNEYTWSLQVSQLSSACGFKVDPQFKGAMLFRFKGRVP